jgi:hypothetical protein
MKWEEFAKNCEIVVVCSKHREPTTVKYMQDYDFTLSFTPDYEFRDNECVKPENAKYLCNQVGALRCYKGHQDALKLVDSSKPYILVFEDDAIFSEDPRSKIIAAAMLLEKYEIVSLHGRNLNNNYEEINFHDYLFVTPNFDYSIKQIHGSLAYLIKQENKNKIIDRPFDGLPMDLYIASNFKFAVIKDSPFVHNTNVKSVLGEAKSTN